MEHHTKIPYYEIMSCGRLIYDKYLFCVRFDDYIKYVSDGSTLRFGYISIDIKSIKRNKKDIDIDCSHPPNVIKIIGYNISNDEFCIEFTLKSERDKYYATDLYYNIFDNDTPLNPYIEVVCNKSGEIIALFDKDVFRRGNILEEGYTVTKLYVSDLMYIRDMYHFYGNEMDELKYKRFKLYVYLGLLETR